MTPAELRRLSAQGQFDHPTAGHCDGYVQANLVVLPEAHARDFETFCRRNPKPCPLLEVVGPKAHKTHQLAAEADLIDTIPRYLVWKAGQVVDRVNHIRDYYRDDLVFFLLGCSFSFEEALMAAGIPLRHIERKQNVSMYRTSIALEPAGPFEGEMVVSMRPIHHRQVAQACVITGHYPDVHGEPVHIGYPEMIGITDIHRVDYGDPVEIREEEIPVFWACGVTPQNVLQATGLPFAITHAPGYMFVSDLRNADYARCCLGNAARGEVSKK